MSYLRGDEPSLNNILAADLTSDDSVAQGQNRHINNIQFYYTFHTLYEKLSMCSCICYSLITFEASNGFSWILLIGTDQVDISLMFYTYMQDVANSKISLIAGSPDWIFRVLSNSLPTNHEMVLLNMPLSHRSWPFPSNHLWLFSQLFRRSVTSAAEKSLSNKK
jgi:hypothetical protein